MRAKKGTRIEIQCSHCQKFVLKRPWEVARSTANKFCNSICRTNWQKEHSTCIDLPCQQCGSIVTRTKSTCRGLIFCSQICSGTYNGHRRIHSEASKQKISASLLKGKPAKKRISQRSKARITEDSLIRFHRLLTGELQILEPTSKLKKRLFAMKLKEERCEVCGSQAYWQDKPLALQLHHIDGNGYNNKLENLSILCPNCHTQTASYAGKVKAYRKRK